MTRGVGRDWGARLITSGPFRPRPPTFFPLVAPRRGVTLALRGLQPRLLIAAAAAGSTTATESAGAASASASAETFGLRLRSPRCPRRLRRKGFWGGFDRRSRHPSFFGPPFAVAGSLAPADYLLAGGTVASLAAIFPRPHRPRCVRQRPWKGFWAGFWPPKPPSFGVFGRSSTWWPRHQRSSISLPASSPAAGEPSCPGAICLAASASPSKRLFGGDLTAEAPIPWSGRTLAVVAGLEASAEHFWPAPSPAPREPSFFGPGRLAAFASPSKRVLTGVRAAGTFSLRRFRPGGVVACSGGTTEPIFAFASVGVAGSFALRPRSPRHLRQAL